ncbi:E3 ubiquitin-protein ligase TRIM33-like [Hippoglossus hippoglossus]|uniref:E3 ubiquitin-protein ligase TRIM33-like n=1 Tax=Hippoglossus hippoglossus TaxID=8267 RepID=UPI00148D1A81|nr:E3 ubiquitin-protein ligase TRIM33-like [Hippoglossus hippoglossus]
MNPFTDSKPGSGPAPCNDSRSPSLSSPPVPQVIPTNHSSPPCDASSDQDGGQDVVRSPVSPLPSFAGLGLRSELEVTPDTPPPVSVPNPYRAPIPRLDSCQVSIIIPSPDLRPSPLPPQCPEDSPDLECAICLSDFNNIFRCPKMLHCKHTFCLECLARINVNSSEPNAIQCPLCRRLTSLPNLGLPRLPTDSDVLSYLPSAMQRVYSIRFLRNKGKLKVKRSSESHQRWGQGSSRDANRTLNVGLPISSVEGHRRLGAVGRARPQYCFLTFPERLHSNQGPDFESRTIKELCQMANIHKPRDPCIV